MADRQQAKSLKLLRNYSDVWDVPRCTLEPTNNRICSVILSLLLISNTTVDEPTNNGESHLDSHANMCVFGKHCFVISCSGKIVIF